MTVARIFLHLIAVHLIVTWSFSQEADNSSPLSTAYYLLSKTAPDSNREEKACLANSFVRVEKYDQAKKVAALVKDYSYTEISYVLLIDRLIEAKKFQEALDFLRYLPQNDPDFDAAKLISPLVRMGQIEEAFRRVKNEDGSIDSEKSFALIHALLKANRQADAELAADSIRSMVFESAYPRDKATLGLIYTKLKKSEKALPFIEASLANVVWTKDLPPADDQFIQDDAFHAYLILGHYDKAFQILNRLGNEQSPRWLIEVARGYLEKGDTGKAIQYLETSLEHLDVKEYGDSFDLGKLIDIYLVIGDDAKALDIAKRLVGNEYMRQKSLLTLADYYFRRGNRDRSLSVLGFAFELTAKIATDDVESGNLWTSGKWTQAGYQADIARNFLKNGESARAYHIISRIRKPYLKALLLAEYVVSTRTSKTKSTQSAPDALEQAVQLLRNGKEEIFDSNRYNAYAKVVRTYAEIGMTRRANALFAEVLSMDREMYRKGLDEYLLVSLCNIGVEFELSGLKSDNNVRKALQKISYRWENEEY